MSDFAALDVTRIAAPGAQQNALLVIIGTVVARASDDVEILASIVK